MAGDVFVIKKDSAAVLDYSLEWAEWLPGGDAIDTSEWFIESAPVDGPSVDSDDIDGTITTAWISGGVNGRGYILTNRIVTAAGRTDERSITLNVVDR